MARPAWPWKLAPVTPPTLRASTPSVHVTANARTLGSRQAQGVQSLPVRVYAGAGSGQVAALSRTPLVQAGLAAAVYHGDVFDPTLMTGRGSVGTGVDTRPVNSAYHPRIHA